MSCKTRYWAHAMQLVVVVGVLALLSPLASFANVCNPATVCFANDGGSLVGSNAGLTLTGSTVTQIGNQFGSNLGTYSLSTGSLLSGSLEKGAVFAAGGSVTITEGATVLFTGTFSSPVDLTVLGLNAKGTGCIKGGCIYTIQGTVSGSFNGLSVTGATIQETIATKTPWTGGSIAIENGQTFIVTPEPGTLGLMGTGFVGISLIARRKMKAKGSVSQANSWL
ncbi:MAG: PEP-CTERM sorting domain-containing protein [Candidatus Sulfotelmatobacter sp.]